MIYEHNTGCLWEGYGFIIEDYECKESDFDKCPHWNLGKEIKVIIDMNEGGYNSTGVCLKCVLDAVNNLKGE